MVGPTDFAFRGRGRLQHSDNCSEDEVVEKFREMVPYLNLGTSAQG